VARASPGRSPGQRGATRADLELAKLALDRRRAACAGVGIVWQVRAELHRPVKAQDILSRHRNPRLRADLYLPAALRVASGR
jgi:hypothetical protein